MRTSAKSRRVVGIPVSYTHLDVYKRQANTIIITNGKIVVDEPSVVALDRRTEKMIAVGEKAKLMHEKTHENIRTIRPLRDGVIADFYACEQMRRGLIKQVNTRNHLFSPSLRMVIGVPSGSTEVDVYKRQR